MKIIEKFVNIALIFLFITSFVTKAQVSKWSVKNGWVVKSNPNNAKEEKFFAIGLWSVPGYTFNKLSEDEESRKFPNNKEQFLKKIKDFNLFYIQSEYGKQYMNHVIKMGGTSEFTWFLQNEYLDNKEGDYASYYMMRKLESEQENNSPKLQKTIKTTIDYTLKEIGTSRDFIWAPFDEIATGYKSWAWPTKVTDMIYQKIKERTPNKLVYIDLLGSSSLIANSFLFEQDYKNKYGKLPQNPPFSILKRQSKKRTLNDFYVNHNGEAVIQCIDGRWQIDRMTLLSFYRNCFENLKKTAQGYKNSGDIFGINSFQYMYNNPALAGITVDAIKAGIGENAPVWLFFDSNGYAKPSGEPTTSYIHNIKCQIYTSIVHGATGVLFWSDLGKSDEVFNALLPIISELKGYEQILFLDTVKQGVKGDIHYVIKEDNENRKYIIAVNTSDKKVYFSTKNIKRTLFEPMEVKVNKLK